MVRELSFEQNGYGTGFVDGDTMRDIIDIFPELGDSFDQRKSYDEYYYTRGKDVTITLDKLKSLNDRYHVVVLKGNKIIILL